jgi:D-arabinose 5-phosphate isomerase GutQ
MPDKLLLELLARDARLTLPSPDDERGRTAAPAMRVEVPVTGGADPPSLGDIDTLGRAIRSRVWHIGFAIHNTVLASRDAIFSGVVEMERWIREKEVVRVIGAGRALLAAAIPANRLSHAGALVYIQHGLVPLPNSRKGGAILAASASGRTRAVLELLDSARKKNRSIRILGVADKDATDFRALCDIFVGLDAAANPYYNPLSALADTGEYMISELLDAMVVAAAKRSGKTERDFEEGHEDLGPTGPYSPGERGAR